jgi:hypothetical protein
MPAPFDLLTSRRLPSEGQIDIWVHSGTGNNVAAGTADAPIASTEEALGRIPSLLWGRRAVIHYLAGHDEVIPRTMFAPPIIGAGHLDDVDLATDEPSWDFVRAQVQLEAEPSIVETLNGTVAVDDSNSRMLVITDATKAWTADQHRGRTVLALGTLAGYGVIWSNTATQLRVTMTEGVVASGTFAIANRSARLELGDPAAFVQSGLIMTAVAAPICLVGLDIAIAPGVGGPALDIVSQAGVSLFLCGIEGGLTLRPGRGMVYVDGCYLLGGTFAPNGQPMALRGSFLDGVATGYHGSGGAGLFDIFGTRAIGCGSLGHGGTSLPEGGFNIDQCWISGSTSHGVSYQGGNRARVRRTRIDTCAGDAIRADGCGNLAVQGVTGSGSTGRGCQLASGVHVAPSTSGGVAVSVSGAQGEVLVDGVGFTWAQSPQGSNSRLGS